jgi:quercetin dioxygenase-like cupin family protein
MLAHTGDRRPARSMGRDHAVRGDGGKKMSETVQGSGVSARSGGAKSVTWVRRSQVPPFSPAPGIQIQPVIGESLMTCWIAMEPGAIVAEHSHANEQLGVVVEGSVSITAAGETRKMVVGDAYVVPSDLAHSGVAGDEGVLLVETFVPIREEYAKAWRAIANA